MSRTVNEDKKWRSWEVSPEGVYHQYNQGVCQSCRYDMWADNERYLYVVGFCDDEKYRHGEDDRFIKVGAEVVKCPGCQTLGWYHTYDDLFILTDRKWECGFHFYWPEAEEAYLAMVAERDK